MDMTSRTVSAQVILPSASGRKIDQKTIITAENIKQFTPSAATVAKATAFFRDNGFDVGRVAGISFSITAPAELFEQVLKVQILGNTNDGVSFARKDGTTTTTLEGDALPHLPDGLIDAITLPERPAFGPESY